MKTKTATLVAYWPSSWTHGIQAWYKGKLLFDLLDHCTSECMSKVLPKLKEAGFTHYRFTGQRKGCKIK